ncbi:uncharacterized protein F5891DRAFT_1194467 [Suillus fuscotomentosus]|uniref:Uncharacterized protein n=1 Tax=Suillus fuscotomentosus TaxID=1912939 RepID=A0AAD4HGZ1_9AGAM|nr:uncharacterized protein F5891DRAFT_1194467 [Suillus fuscotomentosus]KAG1895124.1 hypothetical protein F5891DRAFT_1194467 [Suillus fuscotomentosus]
MKLSLVLSALASIVVLVTAYPMEGAIAKRSDVEKRKELNAENFDFLGSKNGAACCVLEHEVN